MRRPLTAAGLALAALAVLTAMAIFVWPTAYRAFPLRAGSRALLAARQSRATGTVEVLTLEGWRPLAPTDTARAAVDPLVVRMQALAAAGQCVW